MKKKNEQPNIADSFAEIVKGFIVHKEDFEMNHVEDERSVRINFWVNEADMPKALGRSRRNYNALEYMFRFICHMRHKAFVMGLEKPKKGFPEPNTPFIASRNWNSDPFVSRYTDMLSLIFSKVSITVRNKEDATSEVRVAIHDEELDVDGAMEAIYPSLSLLMHISGKSEGRLVRLTWTYA